MSENVKRGSTQSVKKFLGLGGMQTREVVLVSAIMNRGYSELEEEALLKYFELLVATNYLSDAVYMALVQKYTYKEVVEELNKYTVNYLANKIAKDVGDMITELGIDPYVDIWLNKGSLSEEELEKLLDRLARLIEVSGRKISTEMYIDLKTDLGIDGIKKTNDFDEVVYADYVKRFRTLSKNYMKYLIENSDMEYLQYIQYLLENSEKLNEREEEHYELLKRMWMIDEY